MKRVGEEKVIPSVLMKDASYPSPFAAGLEYSAPARGGWTIVHVGMLVPEAHEIFVCAAGCLRGVVLSAAEMKLTGRFSTVAIEEHNVLDGDMEDLIIDGVSDVLDRLPYRPKAVLVYSSCIHHFMGCDLEMCYRILRERYPGTDFTDCYMIPTMRKSGLTPDQIMRRQLYSLLRPVEKAEKHCAILGNCFSMENESDLIRLIRKAGWEPFQITECETYEQYQEMGTCTAAVTTQAVAKGAGELLENKMGMKHFYLPFSYGADEIRNGLSALAEALGTDYDGEPEAEAEAEAAMEHAKEMIGDAEVAIDYTFTPRPFGLARLLVRHGFRVSKLFTDSISGEEREDYLWLKDNAPTIAIYPTVHAGMRRYPCGSDGKTLALGQKAAYFADTPYFVNLIESGGLYGFHGILRLAELMEEAYAEPKDTERLISMKGLGCESCL